MPNRRNQYAARRFDIHNSSRTEVSAERAFAFGSELDAEPDIREYPTFDRPDCVAKCPECGRVQFELGRLRQWAPSIEGLRALLATELELGNSISPLIGVRIILLGSIATPGGPLDVFFARGLTWDDAPTVIERANRLTASQAPVVLVPYLIPHASVWCKVQPSVLAIVEHVHWCAEVSQPNFSSLSTALSLLRPRVPDERWLTVTECAKELVKVVSGINSDKAKSRVSEAANRNRFRTNGKKRSARRIDRESFSV